MLVLDIITDKTNLTRAVEIVSVLDIITDKTDYTKAVEIVSQIKQIRQEL